MVETLRACPAFLVLLPTALVAYAVWPRTRYFGNTAPLLVGFLFVALSMAHPRDAGEGFMIASIPFLLIFVSGVLADLMETRARALITASVWALVGASILWSLWALARVPAG
jgi:hypothetical protein